MAAAQAMLAANGRNGVISHLARRPYNFTWLGRGVKGPNWVSDSSSGLRYLLIMAPDPVLETFELSMPWIGLDPFLFDLCITSTLIRPGTKSRVRPRP